MGFGSDESVAYELESHITSDRRLHDEGMKVVRRQLMKHHARGRYNRAGALKAFMNLAEAGAKNYAREHGGPGASWHEMFPKKIRKIAATTLLDAFEAEARLGNYDHHLPKKYHGKVSGKTLPRHEGAEAESGALFTEDQRQALTEATGGVTEEYETDAAEFARLMKKHWRTVKYNPKTREGEVHMPRFKVKFEESGNESAVIVRIEWNKPLGNILKADAKLLVKNLNKISDIMSNTSL